MPRHVYSEDRKTGTVVGERHDGKTRLLLVRWDYTPGGEPIEPPVRELVEPGAVKPCERDLERPHDPDRDNGVPATAASHGLRSGRVFPSTDWDRDDS